MPKTVKTRFAPSPTGFFHVGSLRTSLYVYLFAKHFGGDFLLRIEDTDQTRKVEGAVENLKKMLKFFGLNWDNKKVMVQSERLAIYQKFAQDLVKNDKAYYCFCTPERLEQVRQTQQQKKLPPMYDGCCCRLSQTEIDDSLKAGKSRVIRFKMPKTGVTEFNDLIRGKVSFSNQTLDDQIILKSDGFPTYHLASVVDDREMEITHVIRGEEWLSSTPKHVLLYQAFGWQAPEFAHLPLLLNPDRSKLSKRQGDVAVEDYLKNGYLPEALLNFVLLLGWNPGTAEEIFDLKAMIKIFDLAKVNKAGAIFDTQKLDWLNGQYIRQKNTAELAKLCQPFFEAAGIKPDQKYLEKVISTEQERIKKLSEIVAATEFFFKEPTYDNGLLLWKKLTKEKTAENLQTLIDELEKIKTGKWTEADLEKSVTDFIKEKNLGVGDLLWPMRVALSGRKASPGPFAIAAILGREKSIARLKKAINLLQN
ncbi:MAG: glutamate--tRNA ligase [Patescibacteria group bacterium]|jgi:glutamyl-tRNA synthetase